MRILLLLSLPVLISGHASLIDPPSRAAMHHYGFPQNPVDYQHNEGFCGGFAHQFSSQISGRFVSIHTIIFVITWYAMLGVVSVEMPGMLTQRSTRHQVGNMPMES